MFRGSSPLRVHHLALKVRDLASGEKFWVGALGLQVVRRQEDELGPRSIWLALEEDAFIALERADTERPTRTEEMPGWHCVALSIEVSDREAWRTKLSAAGYPIVKETEFTLYVRDPEGSLVALSHHPRPKLE